SCASPAMAPRCRLQSAFPARPTGRGGSTSTRGGRASSRKRTIGRESDTARDPARYLPAIEEAALATGVVPAKTPAGFASGSFGPTTAGRMDSYVDQFQALGGSLVVIAEGNRV